MAMEVETAAACAETTAATTATQMSIAPPTETKGREEIQAR